MGLVSNRNASVLILLEDWIGGSELGGPIFLGSKTIIFRPLQLMTYLICSHLQVLREQISMLLATSEPKKGHQR